MLFDLLAQQQPSPGLLGFLPIIVIIGIFYFLILRPMRIRQRNHEAMVAALKKGDRVITSGGIHGTVTAVREHSLFVRVADNVKLEITKNSIASLQSRPGDSDSG